MRLIPQRSDLVPQMLRKYAAQNRECQWPNGTQAEGVVSLAEQMIFPQGRRDRSENLEREPRWLGHGT
jgi:hypothetical protein